MAIFLTIIGAIIGIACLVNLLCLLAREYAERKTKNVWVPALAVLTISFGVLFSLGLMASYENYFYDTYQEVNRLGANIRVMEQREIVLAGQLKPLVDQYQELEKILLKIAQERDTQKLLALFERYPDLKASVNFQKLMDQLFLLRDGVARAQLERAAQVRRYNSMNQTWPSRLFKPAGLPNYIGIDSPVAAPSPSPAK